MLADVTPVEAMILYDTLAHTEYCVSLQGEEPHGKSLPPLRIMHFPIGFSKLQGMTRGPVAHHRACILVEHHRLDGLVQRTL